MNEPAARQARIAWGWYLAAALLLAAVIASATLAVSVRHWLRSPLTVPAGEAVPLVVARGESFAQVAAGLAARGILAHPRWLVLLARHRGDAVRIQAGEYRLDAGLTPVGLLRKLVEGDVHLYSLTLIEGWTFRQALAAIRAHEAVTPTATAQAPATLRAAMGVLPGTPPCAGECAWADLEGQLFPDTYRFAAGTTDVTLLRTARELLERELTAAWAERAEKLPLGSPYEALVLASIVEKETGLARERPAIAGVFTRRLQRGMRLQSDPTVIYGVGAAYAGDITREHLRTDTPYNTYTRHGLPPTPVALAGAAAIRAATQPATGTALYFVASGAGDGSHRFSETLQEHQQAVQRYLQQSSQHAEPQQ